MNTDFRESNKTNVKLKINCEICGIKKAIEKDISVDAGGVYGLQVDAALNGLRNEMAEIVSRILDAVDARNRLKDVGLDIPNEEKAS